MFFNTFTQIVEPWCGAGDTEGATKRGRGRPPKLDAERKRGVLSMRVRDNMREALAARAAADECSISEEAEYLLERAMQAQGSLLGEVLDLAFDSEAAGISLVIAQVAQMVGGNSGAGDWLSEALMPTAKWKRV